MTATRAVTVATAALLGFGALYLVHASKVLRIRGEEIALTSGDATLAATLARPRWGDGPFPAVVVVHGSGRVLRRDLRAYGGKLVPLGMIVLFYDKRGAGESGGAFRPWRAAECETLIRELAEDVSTAVRYLKGRADVDPDRIGLVGGSQAGWVMPIVAARDPDIAFIVSLSAPAVSCGQVDFYQRLTGVGGPSAAALPDPEVERRVGGFAGPPGYDPTPVLESITVPMLWILGGRDLNVPAALTASIVEGLAEEGRSNHTLEIYPDADHDLHHAVTGRLIDPLPDIRAWLGRIGVLP